MKLAKETINKILIIKLRGIGDVVLSTIILDNLFNDFPNAQIDYLVEKPAQPGLIGIKGIHEILLFERKSFFEKLKLLLKIRKIKYDLIIDLFTNPSTAIITFLSGAKNRAGFPYRGRKYAYNIFGPIERGKFHSAILNLKFLSSLGISNQIQKLHYYINQQALLFADKYFKETFSENDFVIGLCPTGGWPSKKCNPEKFAEIANSLVQISNVKILIIWGKSDKEDADKIYSQLNSNAYVAPDTSIQELAALISHCKILIANDSGPMHIATAVGTPVLGLYGPTSPLMQGPFGNEHEWVRKDNLDCIECNLLVCPKAHECFRDLSTELVIKKIQHLILKNNLQLKLEEN